MVAREKGLVMMEMGRREAMATALLDVSITSSVTRRNSHALMMTPVGGSWINGRGRGSQYIDECS